MASFFLDTSALVKLYHPEAGTKQVESIFEPPENRLIVARLTLIELESAFATKVRTGAIRGEQRRQATARFYVDLASRINVIALTEVHFSVARLLVLQYGAANGLRTLDALQLSVASELSRMDLIDSIVTADRTLGSIAKAHGVPVIDPTAD